MASDLSYSAEEATRALEQSNENASNAQEQMNNIIQKVSSYFDTAGTAVGGDLGNIMGNSFESDIKPVFDNLNNELTALIESIKTTNVTMQNVQDETTQLYNTTN